MSEIKMLPLPEALFETGSRRDLFNVAQMQGYARANVAHATAAKDDEIERLRDQVDVAAQMCWQQSQFREQAQARAERLAEALRLAEEHINDLTTEWYSAGQRVLAEIRAALRDHDQEGGNP